MSEHKEPIPSRIYNAAVGGHVAGAEDIFDDAMNKDQHTINSETATALNGKLEASEKGAVNGVASLDEGGKVPSSQLPFTPDEEDLTVKNDKLKLADKTYDSASFSGMGRVYLRKNMVSNVNTLTQDMFYKGEIGSRTPNTNTVFIIQYDYTIAEDITIPDDCVLQFDGGSIGGNHVVDLNNCQITAPNICIFKGVTLEGTTNNVFNLCWLIDSNDITDIINGLPNTINKIQFVSENTYYLNDTVVFNDINYLNWNTKVKYIGTNSNISVIKFNAFKSASVHFRGGFTSETAAVNQLQDNTNVVGLEVINSQNSFYHISDISYFNENVRVSGLGAGCCNNTFLFGLSLCSNRHLRIYQNDVNGQRGWTNENYFYGGHFMNTSNWKNDGNKSTAIHIEGGNNDSYDAVNALTFIGFNVEGYGSMNGYTIYAKNTKNSSFLRIRNENGDKFAKLVGECYNIDINASFGTAALDITQCIYNYPLSTRTVTITNSVTVDFGKEIKKTTRSGFVTSDILCSSVGNHTWSNTGTSFSGLAFDYSDVAGKVLFLKGTKGSFRLAFVKNNSLVTPLDEGLNPFYTFETGSGYKTSSGHYSDAILIPSGLDVDKVCVGMKSIDGVLTVSSDANLFYDRRPTSSIGNYADVPSVANDIPLGHEYYCTDLNKKIMWNGSAWVNLDGTALS